MQALGDKIGSTIIAQSAGVPVISWNGDGIQVDYQKEGITESIYDDANVKTAEAALECSDRIGYPVMIKASEGGGGKGIRKVTRSADVLSLFRQVQAEIPGSPIFVMKMASSARHLEVQLLADKHGNAIALSGRDCSVQRRHQKIIEEGPPVAAPLNVFKKMEDAAVALAKAVGYQSAGTVEYLYMEETQTFAFLELNPRLQVEHPVTENILGINLPCCQLQVAMGIPLHRIADIRKLYGRHIKGVDTIDFQYSEKCCPPRHCIAVRVTAENPECGFQPTSGLIRELHFHSAIDVWGYFSVNNSSLVHEFADSQFGHIFASGSNRENARRAMVVALKELQIRGEIRTTQEYIVKLLQSDDFVCNNITTEWLDGRIANHKEILFEEKIKYSPPESLVATCGVALQGFKKIEENCVEFINMLRAGQVPSKDMLTQQVSVDLIFENIKYSSKITQSGQGSVVVECNNSKQNIQIRALSDGGYLMNVGGGNHVVYMISESGGSLRMILDGNTCLFTPEYDPTRLTSSVAGKLARLLVAGGTHIKAGDPFVEIEVMKMYMPLKAEESGIIHFQMTEGATLKSGALIATVTLDNPDKVVKSEIFSGILYSDQISEVSVPSFTPPNLIMRESLEEISKVFSGYFLSEAHIQQAFHTYLGSFNDKLLPFYEMEEAMSFLRGRIDADLSKRILDLNSIYKESINNCLNNDYPSGEILSSIQKYLLSLPVLTRVSFSTQISPIWNIAEKNLYSPEVRILAALQGFIDQYLNVEVLFDSMSFTDVVSNLRKNNIDDLDKVLELVRSHVNIDAKNFLLITSMEEIKKITILTSKNPKVPPGVVIRNEITTRNLKNRLTDISKLKQTKYSHTTFVASLLLMTQYSLKPEQRRERLFESINSALTTSDPLGTGDRLMCLKKFVDSNVALKDLVFDALGEDKDYQVAILEMYLLKIYQSTHNMTNFESGYCLSGDQSDISPWIKFEFKTKLVEPVEVVKPMKKTTSFDDLTTAHSHSQSLIGDSFIFGLRVGIIASIANFSDLPRLFPLITSKIPSDNNANPINAMHIIISSGIFDEIDNDNSISTVLSSFLETQENSLRNASIKRVTFLVSKQSTGQTISDHSFQSGSLFTFRMVDNFSEVSIIRHIEAPHAFHLDLARLSNFVVSLDSLQTSSGNVFLYKAESKEGNGLTRYFSRLVSFTANVSNNEAESLFVEALDNLSLAIGQNAQSGTDNRKSYSGNHIFYSIVAPDVVVDPTVYENEIKRICDKYWYKMIRLCVATVEIKISCKLRVDGESLFVRLIASNPTGFVLKIDKYYEAIIDGKAVFKSIDQIGPLDGIDISTPYPTSLPFERQRSDALAASDTLYVYDWPTLFECAVSQQWNNSKMEKPKNSFKCNELVLCDEVTKEPFKKGWTAKDAEKHGILLTQNREPGLNDVGMVAWLATFFTPENPEGRNIVIICNDITFQAGSFGTKEDILFLKASQYARDRGIPRLFLAANSGARIGMAQSLKSQFQVCWNVDQDPSKGFKYIYVTKCVYDEMMIKANGDESKIPIICSPVEVPNEETRYMITGVIGEEPDLGVENLMGSGLIAGETSRAYDEIFTLTMVVGRTVGIGAYLVRLGQRTIQKTRNSPIILTGYQALNKLMGREIYTTNDQLGGPMIMFPNGVAHLLTDTHMESVIQAMNWLSFVPSRKGSLLPIRDISDSDSIEREVEFTPTKGLVYDPRLLLTGIVSGESTLQSGFFDKNSFVEALSGWAKTVVVGRGRLGGIPMGVIVTENRTAEANKPADPADITSREKIVQQAGGVWFPDSAYKTSQSLRDFNREGLPCIIFANWRGFSGGQRDMFDEVLKFGSMIVDSLVAYQQPIFVYIPPFSELRGGAWVVVDSTINPDVMEFYAAEDSRGGVLEAAGAASIKFREKDVIATANRIDPELIKIISQIELAKKNGNKEELNNLIEKQNFRLKMLFGIYQQIAVHFADLHDTPGRMKAKGVIKKQVQWSQSRSYFYWRLKRRLIEFDIANKIHGNTNLPAGRRKEIIKG
jgi:acetyl-CoA carboxylase/biotin carboxylase 1